MTATGLLPMVPLEPVYNPDPVKQVFEFWAQSMGHMRAKLDAKRRKRIQARLNEGATVDELCRAISGAKLDPFLMGDDPRAGRKFDGIETILRDRAQVERLIELHDNPRKVPEVDTQKRAAAAWNSVVYAIQRIGAHGNPPRFRDPVTSQVVARFRWRNLCLGDENRDRVRFISMYNELASKGA